MLAIIKGRLPTVFCDTFPHKNDFKLSQLYVWIKYLINSYTVYMADTLGDCHLTYWLTSSCCFNTWCTEDKNVLDYTLYHLKSALNQFSVFFDRISHSYAPVSASVSSSNPSCHSSFQSVFLSTYPSEHRYWCRRSLDCNNRWSP